MYIVTRYTCEGGPLGNTDIQGSPEGPATGDLLRVLKHIMPATNFGSILFLVQHFKCIFYRNKEAKQLLYFVRQTNILLTSISVL